MINHLLDNLLSSDSSFSAETLLGCMHFLCAGQLLGECDSTPLWTLDVKIQLSLLH